MNDEGDRREAAYRPLLALFVVSGAAGLVWQSVWARQLHLVFGTSTFAIATVLTAFMLGLAIGGTIAAKTVARVARPLQVYGLLEIGIGVYALVFPWLVEAMIPVYLGLWRATEPTPVVFGLQQLVLVGTILVPPTAAMGATLPLLVRFARAADEDAGGRVGTLYAVNTLGAVVGTWLCGFVLLPELGLAATTALTASVNIGLGLAAVRLDRTVAPIAPAPPERPGAARSLVLGTAAVAGFASMVYEVACFRVLGLTLGASVYAFSVMLLAFLVGIAGGGWLGGRAADAAWRRGGEDGVLRALVWAELAVGASAWALMYAFSELPYLYVWLFDWARADRAGWSLWVMSLGLSGFVLLVPTTLLGVAFPLTVRAATSDPRQISGAVASVYAANTAGGVLGAALAGFALLPWLEVRGTLALGVVCNVAAAALAALAVAEGRGRLLRRASAAVAVSVAVAVAFPPAWDPMMMTAGMYKYVRSFKDHSREGIRRYSAEQYDLLYYREGLSSVVTVARNPTSGNLWLANNGKIDASTSYDMPTQELVSLLPLAFADTVDDVLVIGLASGITAGAVTLVPEVQRLEVAELEPAIVDAARLFDPWNHGVLDDPRTHLVLNDGRNHVLLAPPGRWDVVVSEPSNPWLTGVSNLFTEEFLRLGKTRLKPGGVWSQWVQLYGMDDVDLRSLLGTFASVYPNVLVFSAAESADLVLLGSDRPLGPIVPRIERLLAWPEVQAELEKLKLGEPAQVLANLLMDRERVLALAGDFVPNTDDNMRIEHRAPLHLHDDTQSINVPLLRAHAWMPRELIGDDDVLWEDTAWAWWHIDEIDRAILGMVHAALLRTEADPVRKDRMFLAFQWFVWRATDGQRISQLEAGLLRALREDFEQNAVAVERAAMLGP
jgi:spermidine synthase